MCSVAYIDIIGVVGFVLAWLWLRKFEAKESRVLNRSTVTASDYTIRLTSVPEDTTEKELAIHFAELTGESVAAVHLAFNNARSPASIDWRLTDAITSIKNQGQCGSCWAFSATEAIESQLTLGTGGKLRISLSPQQIASCTPSTGTYGCDGCNGGFTEGAYEYVKSVAGPI